MNTPVCLKSCESAFDSILFQFQMICRIAARTFCDCFIPLIVAEKDCMHPKTYRHKFGLGPLIIMTCFQYMKVQYSTSMFQHQKSCCLLDEIYIHISHSCSQTNDQQSHGKDSTRCCESVTTI